MNEGPHSQNTVLRCTKKELSDYVSLSLAYAVQQVCYILLKYIQEKEGDSSSWIKEAKEGLFYFDKFVKESNALNHDNLKTYITVTMAPTFTSAGMSMLGFTGFSTLRSALEKKALSLPSCKEVKALYQFADIPERESLSNRLLADTANMELLLGEFSALSDNLVSNYKQSTKKRF